MADEPISDLTAITGANVAAGDYIELLDVSDTGDSVAGGAGGANKKILLPEFGGRFLIDTQDTTGAAGTFSFTTITQEFKHLLVELYGSSDLASDIDVLYTYLNNDTTNSNYRYQIDAAGIGSADVGQGDAPRSGALSGSTSPANYEGYCLIFIPFYTLTSFAKLVRTTYTAPRSSSQLYGGEVHTRSAVTAAVTQIDITTDNDPTDEILGVARLYGLY